MNIIERIGCWLRGYHAPDDMGGIHCCLRCGKRGDFRTPSCEES